jgi:DNA-binding transcriptional regulator YiaG
LIKGIQSEEVVRELREAFLAGRSQMDLAREYGLSKEVVRQAVRYVTYPNVVPELRDRCLAQEARRNKLLDDQKVGEMRTAYRNGMTISELAAQHDVTVSTVRNALTGKSKYHSRVAPIRMEEIRKALPSGEQHPHSKLSNDQVKELRERYAAGGVTMNGLAQDYGISYMHVYRILTGQVRKAVA